MATARELVVKMTIKADDSGIKVMNTEIGKTVKSVGGLESKLESTADKLTKFGKSFSLKVGIPAGLAFTSIIKSAVNFEYALANIAKVNSHLDMKKVKNDIMELSKVAPSKSLEDLSLAYQNAVQTMNPDEVKPFLAVVEKSSIAFDLMASDTAKSLSLIKNNLHMTTKEVEDFGDQVAFAHHKRGNAWVGPIIEMMNRVSGFTDAMKINRNTMLAWGTTMLNSGIDASTTSSALETLARRLSMGEMWEGRKQFQESFAALGGDAVAFAGKMKSNPTKAMHEFLALVKKAGDDGKNVVPLLSSIVGVNYAGEIQRLINALKEANQLEQELGDKTKYAGESQRAWEKIMGTSKMAIAKFHSALERLTATMGATMLPTVNSILEGLTWLMGKFTHLPTGIQKFISQMMGIGMIAGPIFLIIGQVAKLTVALKTLGWVIQMNPYLRAVGLALMGGIAIYDWWDGKKNESPKDTNFTAQPDSVNFLSGNGGMANNFIPQQSVSSSTTKKTSNNVNMGDTVINVNGSGLDEQAFRRLAGNIHDDKTAKMLLQMKYQS